MNVYEYKVIPAPRRGEKARGAKSTSERFAVALMQVMNDLGRDGWEYLRADTLPCEERVGLTGSTTQFQHMLIFRRVLVQWLGRSEAASEAHAPAPVAAEDIPAVLPPLPARAPEGASPTLGPALQPLPSTRPNGRL